MELSPTPKIILSRTDNIGDVVLTLPLARAIKEKYPRATILFLAKRYLKPLIDCCGYIEEFIDWDTLSTIPDKEASLVLKGLGAEVIIHVFPRPEIARVAYKAGIKYRVGTSHRFYNWLYCNKRVDFTRKNSPLHEAQLNFKLAEPLGINSIPSLAELGNSYGLTKLPLLNEEWKKQLAPEKFNLILHPLSRGSARNWDWKNYNHLIEILPADKFKIFVTGTEEESALITENILLYHPGVTDLTGKLSFEQLIAFIANADGLVAASTGPLHIAAALGKKAIGLYPSIRPMHPGRWAPLGPQAHYLTLDKDCIDCKNGGQCTCISSICCGAGEKVVEIKESEMHDPIHNKLRKKMEKLGESIHKIFPLYGGIPIFGMGDGKHKINNASVDHIDSNWKYKDSKYYYTAKKLFIHYTTIDTLISILKSRKIRLYSLTAMDDVKEISYARNIIMEKNKLDDEERMKKERFSLSFCDYEVESKKKSLGMWREYGDGGRGCGIVFEIDTEPMEKWQNCHLSQIYYGKNPLQPVRDAYREYLIIQNEYKNVWLHGIEEIIVSLYCFHKNPIFDYERELRLLYAHRKDADTFNEKAYPCFKNGKKSSFIEIDLGCNSLSKAKPTINIAKVVFGYKLAKKEIDDIASVIQQYTRGIPNERIGFEYSSLTSSYSII